MLTDLKRRGLLDSTLVLWGGEFGRSPEVGEEQGPRPPQYSASPCGWPAAASRAARSYGATDAIGLQAIEKPVHFRDLHTTLLYQMGLDQDALSYMYLGRKERLTEVRGEIIKDIVA